VARVVSLQAALFKALIFARPKPRILAWPLSEGLRVFCKFIRKEFQGDETAEFAVLSLIDDTHPATTELFDNAVMRNSLANQ
jgi:hypothetical protein